MVFLKIAIFQDMLPHVGTVELTGSVSCILAQSPCFAEWRRSAPRRAVRTGHHRDYDGLEHILERKRTQNDTKLDKIGLMHSDP